MAIANRNTKITVGMDISPLFSGDKVRGVGFYTRYLLEELEKSRKITVKRLKNKQEIEKGDYDILHVPYFHPYFLTLPRAKKRPWLVTIHDLIPLKFPRHYPPGIKGKLRWLRQKKRLMKASAIITDSQNSREDITKMVGCPLEKIKVVYLAADKKFKRIRNLSLKKKIKQKYHLPDTFVLYVGDVNWNKNVPGLVRACEKIGVSLVIVGKQAVSKDFDQHHIENRDLVWMQKKAKKSPFIFLLGFVPDKDLVAIYNLATAYCQPSFYEGFGLPVLEAMACGCPVVSSRCSSLPEVGGAAAVYFDPWRKGALAKTLEKVLEDKLLRKKMSREGVAQAKKFSWQKTAQETLEIYFQYA